MKYMIAIIAVLTLPHIGMADSEIAIQPTKLSADDVAGKVYERSDT